MSHARLTSIFVATAILFVAGCAGPAWFVRGEFPTAKQRRAGAEHDESTTNASDEAPRAHPAASATPGEERSLAQVLDDLQRIKGQNPAQYAVIQSVVENPPQLVPAQYQQTLKDQLIGAALRQQGQTAQPPVEQPSTPVSETGPAAELPQQLASLLPDASRTEHAASTLSQPTVAKLAPHVIDADPAGLTAHAAAVQSHVVTAQVTDMPPSQPVAAMQQLPETQTTPEIATAAVAAAELGPGQWNLEIEQALALLNADLARPNLDREEKTRLEIMRRLLYVATNQREEAVSPIEQLDEDEREYWKHQIHGLLVSIDADGKHPTTRRAALALRNLRTATDHLANVSTLDVRNLTFCKEVLSYGEYRVFDSYSFRAKDEVVMYVEIDNFAAHPRGDSFETELHSSYEIVDDAGRRVANVVLPVDKQVSNNRRRDYFIAYLITMPSQITAGSYRLRLTVEDVIGKKSNHAAVDFRIQ